VVPHNASIFKDRSDYRGIEAVEILILQASSLQPLQKVKPGVSFGTDGFNMSAPQQIIRYMDTTSLKHDIRWMGFPLMVKSGMSWFLALPGRMSLVLV